MSWLHIFAHDIFIFFGGFEKLGCSGIFVTRTPIKYIMLSKVSAYFPCQMCHTIYFNSIHTCSYVQKTFSTVGGIISQIHIFTSWIPYSEKSVLFFLTSFIFVTVNNADKILLTTTFSGNCLLFVNYSPTIFTSTDV